MIFIFQIFYTKLLYGDLSLPIKNSVSTGSTEPVKGLNHMSKTFEPKERSGGLKVEEKKC